MSNGCLHRSLLSKPVLNTWCGAFHSRLILSFISASPCLYRAQRYFGLFATWISYLALNFRNWSSLDSSISKKKRVHPLWNHAYQWRYLKLAHALKNPWQWWFIIRHPTCYHINSLATLCKVSDFFVDHINPCLLFAEYPTWAQFTRILLWRFIPKCEPSFSDPLCTLLVALDYLQSISSCQQ